MTHRLIIASNRLPVSIHEADGELVSSRSNGGLATAMSSLFHSDESIWVGWTGMRRELTKDETASLALPPHLLPINLTPTETTRYYDEFANGLLWPLLHGLPASVSPSDTLWREAHHVTEKFADAIEQAAQAQDTIWIHDYHLMLLPAELRRRGLQNHIGFFLHTPFRWPVPSQNLPHIRELCESLLSAQIVGFQTGPDVMRFRKTCERLHTGIPPHTRMQAFPIGIDFHSFDSLNDSPEVKAKVREHKDLLRDKTIIFSLSRLDYTKGILIQLEAFESLIRELPDPTNIVYRLNVAPSREAALEYRELKEKIEAKVAQINRDIGSPAWQPVLYAYENIGPEEIAAWYQAADIHLNLPIADGMNLVAKEYIASRRDPGMLIITDTMGAALQLKDALIIPPEDITAATAALKQALNMPAQDKTQRWHRLRKNVEIEDAHKWAGDFLSCLNDPRH